MNTLETTSAHLIAQFTISTKKGEAQPLRFLIVQEIPHADIASNGSSLSWRNGGGLFKQYGQPATGIGSTYYCNLLTPDNSIPPADYNRTHFAGYNGNASALSFRGKELGEVQIHLGLEANRYPGIKVRGFESPTSSESEMIQSQIIPQLRAFILAHKTELFMQAKARIVENFEKRMEWARQEVAKLEIEANAAIAALKL